MSEPVSPSNRAFLRAIAGPNATHVTAEQALAAADGLAGHPRDGVVDKVEAAALLEVARSTPTTYKMQDALRGLLVQRAGTIAIQRGPQSLTRFPSYLDMDSLTITSPAERIFSMTMTDAKGNAMTLWRDRTQDWGYEISFARASDDTRTAPRMALTKGEADVVALALTRSILRKAASTPQPEPQTDELHARAASAATIASAANERDLSSFKPASVQHPVTDGKFRYVYLDGRTVARFTMAPEPLTVRYRVGDGAWSPARPLTVNEVATLAMSQESANVFGALQRDTTPERAVLAYFELYSMNRDF